MAEANYLAFEKDTLVGCVGVFPASPAPVFKAELGYWLTAAACGRGLAREMVACLTTAAFAEMQLHRLEIRCAESNVASARVAAAASFRLEGTLREDFRRADGGMNTTLVFGRLATDA